MGSQRLHPECVKRRSVREKSWPGLVENRRKGAPRKGEEWVRHRQGKGKIFPVLGSGPVLGRASAKAEDPMR